LKKQKNKSFSESFKALTSYYKSGLIVLKTTQNLKSCWTLANGARQLWRQCSVSCVWH